MKKIIFFGVMLLISTALLFQSCGTSQNTAEREQLAASIQDAVKVPGFTFKATYAHPSGYKSIYLSPYYDVSISPDTVKAYLPFYGRAYSAPMDPREGGYKFTSTEFEYQASPAGLRGSWQVKIVFNDLDRPVTFHFDVWENGKGRLQVVDVNRQAISFQGDIIIGED